MALSSEEKAREIKVLHKMRTMYDSKIDKMLKAPNKAPVLEAGQKLMVSLSDIQEFMKGKTLPYSGYSLKDGVNKDYYKVIVSLLFMSNKNKQIPIDNNYLSFGFNLPSKDGSYIDVSMVSDVSCSVGDFVGIPRPVESPDFNSSWDVVALCDNATMFNIYKPKAIKLMEEYCPTAASLLSRVNIRRMDSLGTLAVTPLDKDTGKFSLLYAPSFVTVCALDEWYVSGNNYKSLEDCYVYVLAFLLTHEMMHLIHHNTSSSIDMGNIGVDTSIMDAVEREREEVRKHNIENIVQDSFINCQIARMFIGAKGLNNSSSLAPMPRVGVNSRINIRAEHNVGFKSFNSTEELVSKIINTIFDIVKLSRTEISVSSNFDISGYAGCDVLMDIDVSPLETKIRTNSGIYQKCINETMKVITDGRVFTGNSDFTAEEVSSDVGRVPDGTMVRVKRTGEICIVRGYNESQRRYLLKRTVQGDNESYEQGDGSILKIPVYKETENDWGYAKLKEIQPFNPQDNAWIENYDTPEEKTSLSDDEIGQMKKMEQEAIARKELLDKAHKNLIIWLISYLGEDEDAAQSMLDNWVSECGSSLSSSVETLAALPNNAKLKKELTEPIFNKLVDFYQISMGLKQSKMPSMPQQKEAPVFHVGDIVWVDRKKKFGKITSMLDGVFELEEMEQTKAQLIDDVENHTSFVSEGMAFVLEGKYVLKKRGFVPTGNMLGSFSANDLTVVDVTYTESDIPQAPNQSGSLGNRPNIPDPIDDDPIKPEEQEPSQSGGLGSDGESGEQTDTTSSDEQSDDSYGNSNAQEDEYGDNGRESIGSRSGSSSNNSNNQDVRGGQGSDGDNGSDSESSNDSDSQSNNGSDGESSNDSDGKGSSNSFDSENGRDSENSYGSGNGQSSDEEDGEDSLDGSSNGDGGDNQSGREDNQSSRGSNGSSQSEGEEDIDIDTPSDSGKSSNNQTNRSSSESGKNSQSSNSSGDDGDSSNSGDGDDPDWDITSDGGYTQSELQKALDSMRASETESARQHREVEQELAEEARKQIKNRSESQTGPDRDEVKAVQDLLGKAVSETRKKAAENAKSDSEYNKQNSRRLSEDEVLNAMGAGSLTTQFNFSNLSDWKQKLEMILDHAIGFDIVTNPNLMNKKLEDAPPGREDEVPTIKNIAILLDCSGSMGAQEFKQVINHMDTMFQVRNFDNVNFHIIGWGPSSVERVLSTYRKVKGRQFKSTIMQYRGSGSTHIVPAFLALSDRAKKFDAIFILTDAELADADAMGTTPQGKMAKRFVDKHRDKIIWALTEHHNKGDVKTCDPTAFSKRRVVIFKKG